MTAPLDKTICTTLRCPKCSAPLLTDGQHVWCSYIGGAYDPACDWGLTGAPIPLHAAFEDDIAIVAAYTGWNRETAQAMIAMRRRIDPTWTADYIITYLLRRWEHGLPAQQRLPYLPLTHS